ncbi:hypothetical protein JOB18_044034 [Solea senegalensis]|uniref:Uncharacterized protein n=1 Tax=Solea senegalensis TaxID=28829 RepID=A0AAV6QZH9_SOLSE|nr:hypothetical protein JOB18_044034 [Solea senegalensis]
MFNRLLLCRSRLPTLTKPLSTPDSKGLWAVEPESVCTKVAYTFLTTISASLASGESVCILYKFKCSFAAKIQQLWMERWTSPKDFILHVHLFLCGNSEKQKELDNVQVGTACVRDVTYLKQSVVFKFASSSSSKQKLVIPATPYMDIYLSSNCLFCFVKPVDLLFLLFPLPPSSLHLPSPPPPPLFSSQPIVFLP